MTGKTKRITVLGRTLTFFNQRCRDWTHPYPYQQDGGNLANSGCGIFGTCHAVQWLTGEVPDAEELADFSVQNGGRGDDGTDRPGLLHALSVSGRAARYNFTYNEDGLRNDLDTLYAMLSEERGVSLCNLRVGHIVCLVAAREREGRREVLAIDSYSESASEKIRDHVREVVPGTEIGWPVRNADGYEVGRSVSYGAFWADLDIVRDFNLLWRVK